MAMDNIEGKLAFAFRFGPAYKLFRVQVSLYGPGAVDWADLSCVA